MDIIEISIKSGKCDLNLGGVMLSQVEKFKHLGVWFAALERWLPVVAGLSRDEARCLYAALNMSLSSPTAMRYD